MTPMDPRRHRASLWRAGLALGVAALLAACAHTTPPTPREAAPQAAACPQGTPTGARCLRGQDSAGAHYLIVMPEKWNRVLVVHAHGGPTLGEPKASRADEDIQRWAITVKAGYAWAGSVFRQGGVAVRSAAEDTERVRRIFVEHVAQPRRTLLHGQSWGANVAAKAAEQYAAQARTSPYDAVLLSAGVLAGGTRAYDFRLDLRVVYQYLCNNHPRPTEVAYPLNIGLPVDAHLRPRSRRERALPARPAHRAGGEPRPPRSAGRAHHDPLDRLPQWLRVESRPWVAATWGARQRHPDG